MCIFFVSGTSKCMHTTTNPKAPEFQKEDVNGAKQIEIQDNY